MLNEIHQGRGLREKIPFATLKPGTRLINFQERNDNSSLREWATFLNPKGHIAITATSYAVAGIPNIDIDATG